MSTRILHSLRGSTASSALPGPRAGPGSRPADAEHPPHRLGSALRATGVFLDTAFRVVVLGSDGTPRRPRPAPGEPRRNTPRS